MPTKQQLLKRRHQKKQLSRLAKRRMNPEFTTAIRVAKLFRVACCSGALQMKPDRSRFRKLARFILHSVIHADRYHNTGERQILNQHLKVFEGYEFDPDLPLRKSIHVPFTSSIIKVDHMLTVSFPSLNPATQITWPTNATHCSIIAAAIAMDFQYYSTIQESTSTEWMEPIDTQVTPLQLRMQLPPNELPLFLIIGIAYRFNDNSTIICPSVKVQQVAC